jgi:UDP-N-acetylglucosamine 4,6-dehydratase
MTRFWISIESAVKFVIDSLEMMTGGELYVPKIPSMKIIDLAHAVAPEVKLVEIGMRPGEKLHEEMIASDDSYRTIQQDDRYVVKPTIKEYWFKEPVGEPVPIGFSYSSDTNDQWMTAEELRGMVESK